MFSQKIGNTARSFFLAARRCYEIRPKNNVHSEILMVPAVVCLAFSIELYLKGIIFLETGVKPERIHKLLDLFKNLSQKSQKNLLTALSFNETELLKNIKKTSNTFTFGRYIHEQESGNLDNRFLTQLANETKSLFESMLTNNLS